MEWHHHGVPEITGNYLIAVRQQREYGTVVFNYIAHFDQDKGLFYKYNPFNDEIGEQIKDYVTGWASDVGTVV